MAAHRTRWRRVYDKCSYGFYRQDDVREIVAYAASRHVVIVPEIEVPSHSSAALACYPELLCPNWTSPVEKVDSYFHFPMNYCAGNEKSFEFLEGVLAEVMELFPGPYIQIGRASKQVSGRMAAVWTSSESTTTATRCLQTSLRRLLIRTL